MQKTAIDSGNPPLIIAVDQEGGRIERFSFGRERLKNNADIKTSEEAFEKGKFIATELKDLGINCDFAPVVDINSNPLNPVINVRSFGNNSDIVSEFGRKFLECRKDKRNKTKSITYVKNRDFLFQLIPYYYNALPSIIGY